MRINVSLLAKSIIGAAQRVGTGTPNWMRAHPIAEVQLKALATATGEIDTMLRLGQIGETRARDMYRMSENAIRQVLLDEGAERTFADKLLQAAAGVIVGPMGRAVAGGLTSAFKAGKDL